VADRLRGTFKQLDAYTLEMIIAIGLITLYDFLLSDAMSIPLALQHSTLGYLRFLDRIASGLEFLVPAVVFVILLVLWLLRRNDLAHHIVIGYLVWVTLRLIAKVVLVLEILLSRPQKAADILLTDTVVLWFVIVVLFSVWYWIIDGGGPRLRHAGTVKRFDFAFPQRMAAMPGWDGWRAGFWDYIHLGFSGSTQFSFGETGALSVRAKFLFMLQITLSFSVIVFILSIGTGLVR
jgi:hypothetical protein